MTSRRLPQTDNILKNENAALKNRITCLGEELIEAYTETKKLYEIIKTLKKEKAEVEQILQYREEFIENHCA